MANLTLDFRRDPDTLIRISFQYNRSWSAIGTSCDNWLILQSPRWTTNGWRPHHLMKRYGALFSTSSPMRSGSFTNIKILAARFTRTERRSSVSFPVHQTIGLWMRSSATSSNRTLSRRPTSHNGIHSVQRRTSLPLSFSPISPYWMVSQNAAKMISLIYDMLEHLYSRLANLNNFIHDALNI